jgi:hypothetical protein
MTFDIDDLDLQMSSLDPLKVARRDKLLREIRNEDLKLAVAEGQFMLVEAHRQELSDIVSTVITSLDTLPDVMERRLALEGHIVEGLRKCVDDMRDNLHLKLMELQADQVEPEKPKLPDWMCAPSPAVEQVKQAEPAKGSKPKLKGRPTNAERVARLKEGSVDE